MILQSCLRLKARLEALPGDCAGIVAMETALVAPFLILASIGTFEISRMVARQHELQVGATDVEGIVLAVSSGNSTDTTTIKSVLVSSLSLDAANIKVSKVYRCETDETLLDNSSSCPDWDKKSTYVKVELNDTYTPIWRSFGVGGDLQYNFSRTIQIS